MSHVVRHLLACLHANHSAFALARCAMRIFTCNVVFASLSQLCFAQFSFPDTSGVIEYFDDTDIEACLANVEILSGFSYEDYERDVPNPILTEYTWRVEREASYASHGSNCTYEDSLSERAIFVPSGKLNPINCLPTFRMEKTGTFVGKGVRVEPAPPMYQVNFHTCTLMSLIMNPFWRPTF